MPVRPGRRPPRRRAAWRPAAARGSPVTAIRTALRLFAREDRPGGLHAVHVHRRALFPATISVRTARLHAREQRPARRVGDAPFISASTP